MQAVAELLQSCCCCSELLLRSELNLLEKVLGFLSSRLLQQLWLLQDWESGLVDFGNRQLKVFRDS